jgi:hypothetical protein
MKEEQLKAAQRKAEQLKEEKLKAAQLKKRAKKPDDFVFYFPKYTVGGK